MEGQGKNILVAVAIAFGIMMVWNMLFPPEKPKSKKSSKAVAAETLKPAVPKAEPVVIPRGEEQRFKYDVGKVEAEFSSYGAALVSWKLKQHFTDSKGEVLDFVPSHVSPSYRSFQIGFVDGAHGLEPSTLPIVQSRETEWTLVAQGPDHIEFSLKPEFSSGLTIRKRFDIDGESLSLKMSVRVENITSETVDQRLAVDVFGYQDPKEDQGGGLGMPPVYWAAACSKSGNMTIRKHPSLVKAPGEVAGDVTWGGINHSYFLIAAAPNNTANSSLVCQTFAEDKPGAMRTRMIFPQTTMKAGAPMERSLVAYLGPKYLGDLEVLDANLVKSNVLSKSPGFSAGVDLGTLSFIARPLLWLLVKFYGLVGNWGIAIILLTITVKLATLYFHTKSMRSMRAMGKLKPEIDAINAKHKDDKQKAQQEIMAMYKNHGVNPLAGCLPMLLQMPIWFALYRMLMRAAELYQADFLWIDDLTATDPLYILPIAVMAAMFVQTRLSPTPPDSTQQKIMLYVMPIMFGAFSFVLPSGLVLYMLTNTILTALHSLYMYRTEPSESVSTSPSGAKKTSPAANKKKNTKTSGRKK